MARSVWNAYAFQVAMNYVVVVEIGETKGRLMKLYA